MNLTEGLLDISLKQEIELSGFLAVTQTEWAKPGQFTVLADPGDNTLFAIMLSPEMTITDLVQAIEEKSGTHFTLMVNSKILAETAGNSVRGRNLRVKDYLKSRTGYH
jgi:hypothetical protein